MTTPLARYLGSPAPSLGLVVLSCTSQVDAVGVGGWPPALSVAEKVEVRRMRDQELRPLTEIAQIFKVSTKTIRRA